jgi:hypothetical protein
MTTTEPADLVAPKLAPAFCGWRRSGNGAWALVCESLTESDCWRQVFDIARELGGHGSSAVLPVGRHPGRR